MKRLITIVMLTLMTFMLATVVTAQDAPPVFCGNLSAEDCAILEQSQTAMMAVSSASATFNFNLAMSGIPDLPDPAIISITGDGQFSNGTAFLPLADLGEDAEVTTVVSALATALQAFNGALNVSITIPAELADGIPNTIALNLRLVDGVGYINFDALQPLLNDPSFTGWGGLDFTGLLNFLLEQQPELFNDPSITDAFSEGFSAGFAASTGGFDDPERMADFVTIQRVADEGGAAVFESSVDFAALLQEPEFADMLREQMESQGQSMTDAEFSEALTMVESLFENSSIVVRQAIDPATGYTVGSSGSFNFDLTSVAAMSGDSSMGSPIINIDFEVNTSDVNATSPVTAPEGASLFPYQMMLGGMMNQ